MSSQAVFGSPIRKFYGETVSLTTTAAHLLFQPGYHEVKLYCPTEARVGLAPRLARVKLYSGAAYTDYTSQAIDKSTATHIPLDGMTTAKYLYMGTVEPVRGFYFTIDGTNKNTETASLDMEYMYDIASQGYIKLTGTISGALTVGETVTGSVSGATGVAVYDDGSTYLVVKTTTGKFSLGENAAGASQACNTITARDPVAHGTGYFTDVASDSDGTDVGPGSTLQTSGLYSFTLPSVVRGPLAGVDNESLYWYRFKPSATLSATVDIQSIIPACDTVNYGYLEAGMAQEFSVNLAQCGAFEFDHTATDTLNVTWIAH